MDYALVRAKLEEAYLKAPDAESLLREILIIWSEFGIMEGEWCCTLAEAG